MLHLLSKLTGYDSTPNFFTVSEIIKEANRKFSNTYLIINDKIEYVEMFREEYISVLRPNEQICLDRSEVLSIESWMPEPGIYMIDEDTHIYLHRIPKRQWLKSFSLFNNYSYITVNKLDTTIEPSVNNVQALYDDWLNAIKNRDWMFKDDYLIYKFHVVGKLNGLTIHVTDASFYQEITEKWHKHYNITLAKAPQNQEAVES